MSDLVGNPEDRFSHNEAHSVVTAEQEEADGDIVTSMDTTCTRYKIEIGPDNTRIMTNKPGGFQREIKIKGQRLASNIFDQSPPRGVRGYKLHGRV